MIACTRLCVLLVVGLVGLAGCEGAEARAPVPSSEGVEPALLEAMALLTVGALPTAEERRLWAALPTERAIDAIVMDPRFSHVVAPRMLLHQLFTRRSGAANLLRQLHTVEKKGKTIAFLEQPCDPDTAVEVAPWWAPDKPLLVCPDSYRPEVHTDGQGFTCSGSIFPVYGNECGCGPSLVYCGTGPDLQLRLNDSLRAEVADTVAHIVDAEQPIDLVYTGNETHRDGVADFYYQRGRLLAGEIDRLPDPRSVPAGGAWAPRTESWPGQHAGILTTYHYLHISDAPRDRMRDTFAEMYCVETASVNVSTDDIRKLGVTDLREGEGWKDLAAMPVCTDCHARLDYGMQFFSGFPSTYKATHFVPGEHRVGEGPFYLDTIKDQRGSAALTPSGFANLAVAQPEFDACIVRNVARHVFAFDEGTADREALTKTLGIRRSLRDLMKVALQRFAARWRGRASGAPQLESAQPAPASVAAPAGVPGAVTLSAEATSMITHRCGDCHDQNDDLVLVDKELPRASVLRALDELASLRMPRFPGVMEPEERRALVRALIDAAFDTEDERAAARWYWQTHQTIAPLRPFAVLSVLQRLTGGGQLTAQSKDFEEGDVPADISQFSPGFAATIGTSALLACKAASQDDATLRECVTRATNPRRYMNDVPPATSPP